MKLFIPLICYNHNMNTEYAFSMMNLILFLRNNNINASLYPITFDSLIPRARNSSVAFFLNDTESTHILFIDSDIEFQPADVLKLINEDKEVIGGSYGQKWIDDILLKKGYQNNIDNVLEISTRSSIHLENPIEKIDELMKCDYITTGFLLIKRSAFEKIIEKYPDNYYINDVDGYKINNNKFYDFFPTGINKDTRRYESEDYGFSRLYKSVSKDNIIWCNTKIVLKHHGLYGYKNNLYRQLELMFMNKI